MPIRPNVSGQRRPNNIAGRQPSEADMEAEGQGPVRPFLNFRSPDSANSATMEAETP